MSDGEAYAYAQLGQQVRYPQEVSNPPQEVQERIQTAYLSLTQGNYEQRVRLSALRSALSQVPPDDLDKFLRTMQLERKLILMPLDDPQEISPADEQAAIDIGGDKNHLVYLREHALVSAPESKAEVIKAEAQKDSDRKHLNTDNVEVKEVFLDGKRIQVGLVKTRLLRAAKDFKFEMDSSKGNFVLKSEYWPSDADDDDDDDLDVWDDIEETLEGRVARACGWERKTIMIKVREIDHVEKSVAEIVSELKNADKKQLIKRATKEAFDGNHELVDEILKIIKSMPSVEAPQSQKETPS